MGSKVLGKFLKENLEDLKSKGLYNVINVLKGENGPSNYNWRQKINKFIF